MYISGCWIWNPNFNNYISNSKIGKLILKTKTKQDKNHDKYSWESIDTKGQQILTHRLPTSSHLLKLKAYDIFLQATCLLLFKGVSSPNLALSAKIWDSKKKFFLPGFFLLVLLVAYAPHTKWHLSFNVEAGFYIPGMYVSMPQNTRSLSCAC